MKKKKKWIKKRHSFIVKLLNPIFKFHFKSKYNLKCENFEKEVPTGSLIMCNHLTTMDPFMIGASFSRPLYYVASDDLFTIPVISRIIKFLVEPIPKSKSKSDLNTVRYTLQVLKEGGSVVLFPEGNRSLSGGNWEIDLSAAKLAKMCKAPLVFFNITGGYGADPRWGKGVRKGRVTCRAVKIIPAEKVATMSVEEIYREILINLTSCDYDLGIKFKSKNRAEYLERALYYCPNCKTFNSLYSSKQYLYCKHCDLQVEYTEDLQFKKINGEINSANVYEWFNAQKEELKTYSNSKDSILFNDNEVTARLIKNKKRHKLGLANIKGYNDKVIVEIKNKQNVLDFNELVGVTVLGKRKINFYLPDDKTLQIKGNKRFNAIKYLHLFELSKGEK